MKRRKILFLSLLLCCMCAFSFGLAGCKEDGGSSSSDPFAGEQEETITLRFLNTSVDVYQYENVLLGYTVKGTAEAVRFSSSNEAIVTVDENGLVMAKGVVGTAQITASVDGVEAVCEVRVTESPYVPTIVVDATEYTLEKGGTLEFDVQTMWNREILTEPINYSIALADSSTNVISNATVEGNVVDITAGEAGTANVYVFTTVRGIYTSKLIAINVVEAALKIVPTNEAFQPAVGGYEVRISTTNQIEVAEMENELDLSFVVSKGSTVYDGANIAWSMTGDAATLENGKLIGKKVGTVVLTGTATVDNTEAKVKVTCEVIPPEVQLEESHVIEIKNLTPITLESALVGAIQEVKLHGEKINLLANGNTIVFNAKKFPQTARLLGAQTLEIYTDLVYYTMDVEIYTFIINDADELDQMTEYAKTDEAECYDGYFALGNDIDYNRAVTSMTNSDLIWVANNKATGAEADMTRGFKGVFDGKGYNIDAMTVGKNFDASGKENKTLSGGLFGYLAAEGVVKNVSFTNATLLTNNGFICSRGAGTIENVSISYKKIGDPSVETYMTGGWGYRMMGSFFSMQAASGATVKNCLVDVSSAEIFYGQGTWLGEKQYDVKLIGSASNVSNVILICADDTLLEYSGANVKKHSYVEAAADDTLLSEFDDAIWTTVNGVPMFVEQAKDLDVNAGINFVTKDSVVIAGIDLSIIVDNPYTKLEVSDVDGVAIVNGILSATEEAYGKTVVVTATSLINEQITATKEIYVDSFGEEMESPAMAEAPFVYDTNPVLSIGDNSWLGVENYLYYGKDVYGTYSADKNGIVIDTEKFGYGTKTVTIVVVDQEGARKYFVTDVTIWYETKFFSDATKIQENAFSDGRSFGSYTLVDVEADIDAPSGYEQVKKLTSTNWTGALNQQAFNKTNLGEYADVWFALKVVGATYSFQRETIVSGGWVYFHFTQTSDNVWAVEVTIGDVTYNVFDYEATGSLENSVANILYRTGISTGFLLYPTGASATNPACIYSTEIRGVKK